MPDDLDDILEDLLITTDQEKGLPGGEEPIDIREDIETATLNYGMGEEGIDLRPVSEVDLEESWIKPLLEMKISEDDKDYTKPWLLTHPGDPGFLFKEKQTDPGAPEMTWGEVFSYSYRHNLLGSLTRISQDAAERIDPILERIPVLKEFTVEEGEKSLTQRIYEHGERHTALTAASQPFHKALAIGLLTVLGDLPGYVGGSGLAKETMGRSIPQIYRGLKTSYSAIKTQGGPAVRKFLKHVAESMGHSGITFSTGEAIKAGAEEDATFGDVVEAGLKGGAVGVAMGVAGGYSSVATANMGRLGRVALPIVAKGETLTNVSAALDGRVASFQEHVYGMALVGAMEMIPITASEARHAYKYEAEGYLRRTSVERIPKEMLEKIPKSRQQSLAEVERIMKELKENPELITHFENLTPEGHAKIGDHFHYRMAKVFAPEYAEVIGIKRGIIEPPKTVKYRAIQTLQQIRKTVYLKVHEKRSLTQEEKTKKIIEEITEEVVETDPTPSEVTNFNQRYLGGKSIESLKEMPYSEIQKLTDRVVRDLEMEGKWVRLPEDLADPYQSTYQVGFYPMNKKTGELSPTPVFRAFVKADEAARLGLLSDVISSHMFTSKRYATDGVGWPDLQLGRINFQNAITQKFAQISKAIGWGIINNKRAIAYLKRIHEFKNFEEAQAAIPGLKPREARLAEVAREIWDGYVKDDNYAFMGGLKMADGTVRIKENYVTGIHDTLRSKGVVVKKLPHMLRRPWTRAKKLHIDPENLADSLTMYLYLMEKARWLEAPFQRMRAKREFLPEHRGKMLDRYLREYIGVRDDVMPGWMKSFSQLVAGRIYYGALQAAVGSMVRNLTALYPGAVQIGSKNLAKGLGLWIAPTEEGRRMRALAKDAQVVEQFRQPYFEAPNVMTGAARRLWTFFNNVLISPFTFAESLMRNSIYIGGYKRVENARGKIDWRKEGFTDDVNRLAKTWEKELRATKVPEVKQEYTHKLADLYGRESTGKTQFLYGTSDAAPILKIPIVGHLLLQFWSFPNYYREMIYRGARYGGMKKSAAMLAFHPLAKAFGRPLLGLSFAAFVGKGFLPHLSPFADMANNFFKLAGNLIDGGPKRKRDQYARNVKKGLWLMLPAGRILHDKVFNFLDAMESNWQYIHPVSGNIIQSNAKDEILRVLDLTPGWVEKERELREDMTTWLDDENYVRALGYQAYNQGEWHLQHGRTEEAQKLHNEALELWESTQAGIPSKRAIIEWMKIQNEPRLLRIYWRNRRRLQHRVLDWKIADQEEFWWIIDHQTMRFGFEPDPKDVVEEGEVDREFEEAWSSYERMREEY